MSIKAFGYEWRTKQPWGKYHPGNSQAWYDADAVEVLDDGSVDLSTYFKPANVGNTARPMACGLITSLYKDFGYGEYELECIMPKGQGLWPAFWFCPIGEAPPEIDVFEGETKNNNNYFRFNPFHPLAMWNIKSNAHYGSNYSDDHKEIGPKRSFFTFKNPHKHYIKYKFVWKRKSIKIYYNGIFVRAIRKRKLLNLSFFQQTEDFWVNDTR